MNKQKLYSKKHVAFYILIVFAFISASIILIPSSRSKIREVLGYTYAHLSSRADTPFPNIDTSNLSETQVRIIQIAKDEYKNRPVSFDSSVLKYSEGNKEPWCADFTSWVMKQAGAPYSNPNSGHWRIPGVLTLREYYQSEDRYIPANIGYRPQVGDVAIYIGNKTLDGRSRQHTNIVVSVEGNQMITIGGNERGRMRISRQDYTDNQNSLVGFGTLNKVGGDNAEAN